jgi:hypothetical protein
VATKAVFYKKTLGNFTMSYYVNPHGHQCPWYAYAEMFGAPNVKWCEETLCSWISEPANTWSNIGYLLVAFYLYWSAKKNNNQMELKWFAPAMFLMGLFSLIYHMSNNYLSQIFDFIGMYLYVYWMIIINLKRMDVIERKHYIPLMLVMSIVSTVVLHLMYINHIKFQMIIAVAAIAIALSEFFCYRELKARDEKAHYKFFWGGIILLIIAQSFSLLDGMRVMCDPTNHWFQGHAMWHYIAAIGLTVAYKHFEQFDFSPNLYREEIETQLEV